MARVRFPLVPLELDLTPMIDIVFNLLVFFMCATQFRTSEGMLQAFLPKDRGPSSSAPQVAQDVRLGLRWHDAAGQPTVAEQGFCVLTIEGEPLNAPGELERGGAGASPVWKELHQRLVALRDAYAGDDPDGLPVIIDARPQVPTQLAISTLNELVRARVKNVTFAAPELPY